MFSRFQSKCLQPKACTHLSERTLSNTKYFPLGPSRTRCINTVATQYDPRFGYVLIPDDALSETHQTKHGSCFSEPLFCLWRVLDTDLRHFKISFVLLFLLPSARQKLTSQTYWSRCRCKIILDYSGPPSENVQCVHCWMGLCHV